MCCGPGRGAWGRPTCRRFPRESLAVAPASSASVGRTSQNAQGRSLTRPAAILPGQRTSIGSRMPPSCNDRFAPCSGPLLWKNVGSTPPSKCGPLSLVKKTMVLRSMPSSRSFAIKRPMSASMRRDHGGLALLRRRPGFAPVDAEVGNLHAIGLCFVVGMRNRERQIEKERRLGVVRDEIQRLLGEQLLGIDDFLGGHATAEFLSGDGRDDVGQRHLRLVAPEEIGIVVVGMVLVQVAEPVVEAFLLGVPVVPASPSPHLPMIPVA